MTTVLTWIMWAGILTFIACILCRDPIRCISLSILFLGIVHLLVETGRDL